MIRRFPVDLSDIDADNIQAAQNIKYGTGGVRAIEIVEGRPGILNELPTRTNPSIIQHDDNLGTGFGGPNANSLGAIVNSVPVIEMTAGKISNNILQNNIDYQILAQTGTNANCNLDATLGQWSFGAVGYNGFIAINGKADQKQLVIKLNSTQTDTNPGFEVQDSGGNHLFSVDGNGHVLHEPETGITADVAQTQAAATQTTKQVSEVSTVANAGDAVKLIAGKAGLKQTLINNGANAMTVFPTTGGNINGAGVDAGVSQAVGTMAIYEWYDATNCKKLEG